MDILTSYQLYLAGSLLGTGGGANGLLSDGTYDLLWNNLEDDADLIALQLTAQNVIVPPTLEQILYYALVEGFGTDPFLTYVPYATKVLAVQSANIFAYWKLNELSGTTATDSSGAGHNGAYGGTSYTLGGTRWFDGLQSLLLAGTNNWIDIYSAGMIAAFDPKEFTFSAFIRIPNWNDGSERRVFHWLVDGNNAIVLRKDATNGQFSFIYTAGAVSKVVTVTSLSIVGFFNVTITVNKTANEMKAYINGVQVGSTQVALGTFVGVPSSTNASLAARGAGGTNSFLSAIAQVLIWKVALSGADVAIVASPY